MADDTPAEKAETMARQMNWSMERNWSLAVGDDNDDYWVMRNARNTMRIATISLDRAQKRLRD